MNCTVWATSMSHVIEFPEKVEARGLQAAEQCKSTRLLGVMLSGERPHFGRSESKHPYCNTCNYGRIGTLRLRGQKQAASLRVTGLQCFFLQPVKPAASTYR